jgi:hypothetical protein
MEPKASSKIAKIDWRWVGLGVCFFIVMHLLPTYLLFQFRIITTAFSTLFSVWVFAGMAFVGFFIGWKSKGVTILEAGIASLLYAFILLSAIQVKWEGPLVISSLFWFGAVVVIATVSAWFGELVQSMKERGIVKEGE